MTASDLVIVDLAAENVALQEEIRYLRMCVDASTEALADVAFDLEVAKRFADREFRRRLALQKQQAGRPEVPAEQVA